MPAHLQYGVASLWNTTSHAWRLVQRHACRPAPHHIWDLLSGYCIYIPCSGTSETLTSPKLDEAYAAMGMRSHILPPNIFNVVGFELMHSSLLKARRKQGAVGACKSAWGIKDADFLDIMDGNVGNPKTRKQPHKFLKMFGPFFDSGAPSAKVPSFALLEVGAKRQPL